MCLNLYNVKRVFWNDISYLYHCCYSNKSVFVFIFPMWFISYFLCSGYQISIDIFREKLSNLVENDLFVCPFSYLITFVCGVFRSEIKPYHCYFILFYYSFFYFLSFRQGIEEETSTILLILFITTREKSYVIFILKFYICRKGLSFI
jgi:hypothetical protein